MSVAVIVTDMLNPYEHEDADALMASARQVVPVIAGLVADAGRREIPVIYVNDNQRDWSAGRRELVKRALEGRDRSLIEPIVPPDGAPFVVKARHSVFYETPLEYLLGQFEIRRLVLAGQVTEQCILYSALDAYVRHFEVVIPRDAVAHIDPTLADAALGMMERNMRAAVVSGAECLDVARG